MVDVGTKYDDVGLAVSCGGRLHFGGMGEGSHNQ